MCRGDHCDWVAVSDDEAGVGERSDKGGQGEEVGGRLEQPEGSFRALPLRGKEGFGGGVSREEDGI